MDMKGGNGDNQDDNNLGNNNQKLINENNGDNYSSVITVNETEVERHLQLIDTLIELEIVKIS